MTPSESPPPGASAGREPSYWENQWRRDVMDPHLSDNMRLGIALCLIGEIDSRNVSLRSALAAERAAGEALRTAALDCANDLEAEVRARYGWPDIHPAQQRKFDNDMQPVHTARALAADREEPYPDNPGQTHYDGCWRMRGHHNCAVAEVTALRSALREVQGEFLEAHAMIREVTSRSSTPPGPCICARCREYRALAADRETEE